MLLAVHTVYKLYTQLYVNNITRYNMKLHYYSLIAAVLLTLNSCAQKNKATKPKTMQNTTATTTNDTNKVEKTEAEWKKILSPDVYTVSRLKGTERAGTSKYEHSKETGTYNCVACGNPLFKSNAKFDSGSGWPSFYEPVSKNSVLFEVDNTYGMKRTEVMCGKCKGHLGHVFDDGPKPTGLRYCINGIVLDFKKENK